MLYAFPRGWVDSADNRRQEASAVFIEVGVERRVWITCRFNVASVESALLRPLKYFHISRIERAVHDDGENDG